VVVIVAVTNASVTGVCVLWKLSLNVDERNIISKRGLE